jgi:hypothetical protein
MAHSQWLNTYPGLALSVGRAEPGEDGRTPLELFNGWLKEQINIFLGGGQPSVGWLTFYAGYASRVCRRRPPACIVRTSCSQHLALHDGFSGFAQAVALTAQGNQN